MITIQIQSVIYKNNPEHLMKAIKALKQAVLISKKNGIPIKTTLVYGDASDSPVLNDEYIKSIRDILQDIIEFRYVIFGYNSGTAKGHNSLGEHCNSDYMLIMNPDIIMEPRCLYHLIKALEPDNVGLSEARQTPLEHAKEYNISTGETEWASTACALFKTQLFHDIHGFDAKNFFMYCDDLDFSWRIRLAGKKVIYVPSAIIYHAKNLANDGSWKPTAAEIYYSAEAALLLAYKWSNSERADALCKQFKLYGGDSEQKAAKEFEMRKNKHDLPQQIDPNHTIARFIGDDYCDMRFYYK